MTITGFRTGPRSSRPAASASPGLVYVDETGTKWLSDGASWSSATATVLDGSSPAQTTAANTFTVGPQTLQSDAAGHVAAIDQAAAGQTANIYEAQDSTGQKLLTLDAHGNLATVSLAAPAAPTKGTKAAGDITGTAYQWACTLVNAQGETTLGTKTASTGLTAQQIPVTMPATAPDGCTFTLYRNKTAGGTWYTVTTGLAAGAVYTDDVLDASLGAAAPTRNTTAAHLTLPSLGAITGALTTVADAPAKAVLTSIIAALTALGATDGTT